MDSAMDGKMTRFHGLCAASVGALCEVRTLTAFSPTVWRRRGPSRENAWEVVRSRTRNRTTFLRFLRGRPCSKRPRLSCVQEGGSFFAAAATAGERAPLKTIERYAFLKVRRVGAPVPGARKSLIFD